jgi:hypothetical protein
MWLRVERHFITELLVVRHTLDAHLVSELLSKSYLMSMMHLLLTLTHSNNTVEG